MTGKSWRLLFPAFITLLLAGTSVIATPQEKSDSLSAQMKQEYQPSSPIQNELLLIFQEARNERKLNPVRSTQLYEEFYSKSVSAHEQYYAAMALFEICRVYMDRHLYFTAMEYSLKAYNILTDNHLQSKSNYFMIGIGNCYFQTGNYLVSEGYFRQAEQLFIKTNDFHGEAVALNNIGLVKQKLQQKDSALWYFQKALVQRRKINVMPNIGHSYYYIGTAYFDQGNRGEARKYFEMAIPILKISSDNIFLRQDYISTLADTYFELGKLCDLQGEHNQAMVNYNNALAICDTINEKVKMPDIYIAIGHSYIGIKDLKKALDSYREALQIADSANLPEMKKNCYENIIQVFIKADQNDSVSLYFEKYRLVNDTIQAQMISGRFNEISMAIRIRETENDARISQNRSNMAIAFLVSSGVLLLILIMVSLVYISKLRKQRKIAEAEIGARILAENDLEKLNLELKEINAGKDRFISILSHDLRSPFNALMGFADLLVEETEDKNIPEIRQYSKMVQKISRGAYQLLENLLTWSRLQMGTLKVQPTNLHLYDEVSVVVDSMMVLASRKNIRIRNLVSADALVYADSNMLQSIVRNLISNAVKFTKQEGVIQITSESENDFHLIRVSDTGTGISAGISEKLFGGSNELVSTYGTENEKGHGLGLKLCRDMVEKNGGRIWLESTSAEGSVIALHLPAGKN